MSARDRHGGRYDVVVIGAGPAGAAAAIELCRAGARVLLAERASFPRDKVCGGCLAPRALACLDRLGIDARSLPGAAPLQRVQIAAGGSSARLQLAEGVVVSRAELDLRLLRAAERAGAEVRCRARAHVEELAGGLRRVRLDGAAVCEHVEAPIVLLATGLPPANGSGAETRVGLGQTRGEAAGPMMGEVWMAAGRAGYVGIVRFGDGRLNVAASVRADALASASGPGDLVDAILVDAGLTPLSWSAGWRGTRPLRRSAGGIRDERVVSVGDAAGFWEPFTGEGIGWALEAGITVAAPAMAMARDWTGGLALRWDRRHRAWMRRVQRRSRAVGFLAASPLLARASLAILRTVPPLGSWASPRTRPRFDVETTIREPELS
jgi:flavin-dependent dehydrogenase